MWSKAILCRFPQSEEIPQTPVPQGFAAFRLALSRIPPRHSQSRRATNCATPGYFVILSGWSYSPKPPALPTALHPVVKFLPIQTAYVSGLTFILTYILYINTAESAIFFSARLPHCAAISLSGTALLHISATRYIFNSLNTAQYREKCRCLAFSFVIIWIYN